MIGTKLRNNVCRIECGEEQGTGFLISNNLVLTAYHVVDDNEDIKLSFSKEEMYGEIHSCVNDSCIKLDIAIIKLEKEVDFYEEIKFLDIPLNEGIGWRSRGYPQVKNGRAENFTINSFNYINGQHELLYDNNDIDLNFNKKLSTYSGYSGAPLIVQDCIVGMIRSELPQSGVAMELYGLSIKYFKDVLEQFGIGIETSQCNSLLPLTIENNFLNYLDKHFENCIENENQIKVFAPKLNGKCQDIESFVNELYESIHTFIGNRRDLELPQQQRMANDLRKKFKESFSIELLEQLVGYNLLESDLNAPKVFTSIEQDLSKSSIHLYDCNEEKIFVLSLPIVNRNVVEAVECLNDLINKNIDFNVDSSMVTENFLRHSFSDEQKEYIETLIIPSKTPEQYNIERAFGVFIGFDLSEIPEKNTMKRKDFEEAYDKKIFDMSSSIKEYIEDEILKKYTSFYYFIYLIPFDSTEDFIEISKRILNE